MERENGPIALSVLDLTVVGEGGGATAALQETIALAQAAERWGYRRFWVAELLDFLHDSFPESHPYHGDHVHVVPQAPEVLVWTLGSGTTGAETAARLGLPFAAAFHINPEQALRAVELYRNTFRPSCRLPRPYVMVSVNVTCAPSGPEALSLASAGALMMMRARQGTQSAVPSPGTAERHPYTSEEQRFVDAWLSAVVHGTPDTVRTRLTDLQRRTGADELMLTTLIPEFAARERSYALVAGEFGLSPDALIEQTSGRKSHGDIDEDSRNDGPATPQTLARSRSGIAGDGLRGCGSRWCGGFSVPGCPGSRCRGGRA